MSKDLSKRVRTWTRKDGTVVTRTYYYKITKTSLGKFRNKYLISSTGALRKTNIKKIIQWKFSDESKDFERWIEAEQFKGRKALTVQRAIASYTHDRVAGIFANAGLSVDEVADQLGVPMNYLLDAANWRDGVFYDAEGVAWVFIHNYHDSEFVPLSDPEAVKKARKKAEIAKKKRAKIR